MSRISFTTKLPSAFNVSRALLALSGILAVLVLGFGFNDVHCLEHCGSIVRFQYFHYRNLLFAFVAVQSFGWYLTIVERRASTKWNLALSAILLLITAWVYGVVFKWDVLATFYFSKVAPYMIRFFLL